MPQLKTKSHSKTSSIHQPNLVDSRELISKMLDYEAAAQNKGIDLSTGRFEMLTASERQFYRAELVADYIRLSAGNMGNTQGYFDATLQAFTQKICDMKVPSHELIGTYLAAVDLVGKENSFGEVPALKDAVQRTMIQVLQACVIEMEQRAKAA